MNRHHLTLFITAVIWIGCAGTRAPSATPASAPPQPERAGAIAGVKDEDAERCAALYKTPPADFGSRLRDADIRNFAVYQKTIDGQRVLFRHLESIGHAHAALDRLAQDPGAKGWLEETGACLAPLSQEGEKGTPWSPMEEVFYTDGAMDVEAKQVKRFAAVTGLKPDKEAHYRTLHVTTWPGVLDAIKHANIRKYSIYLEDIGEKLYLFSYFEYVGDDFDADMAAVAKDPVTRRWWQQTDPCQIPLPDAAARGEIWENMEEVFQAD